MESCHRGSGFGYEDIIVIDLIDIKKIFNVGKPNEFIAVDGISLSIMQGKVSVLKGPSGSGKTTLLSLIGCMARPTAGRIKVSGLSIPGIPCDTEDSAVEVTSLPERFLTEVRRKTFGFIFQQFNLIKGITVLENIMLPAYPYGGKHTVLRERALRLLELLNIPRHAMHRTEWLSGGEAQRVTIARALMNEPSVIIADEPTAHLDSKLSHEFMDIVAELKENGKTAVIASHDPLVYESAIVDRVIAMRDGKIGSH
jgi:putative ABC transport system ATP-binding protein